MNNTKSKNQFFFEFLSFCLNYKYPLIIFIVFSSLLSALFSYERSTLYKINSTITLNQDAKFYLNNLNELISISIKDKTQLFTSLHSSDLYKLIADTIKLKSYMSENFDDYNILTSKYDYFSRRNIKFSNSGNSVLIEATLYGKKDAENSLIFFNETINKYLEDITANVQFGINKFEEFYILAYDTMVEKNQEFIKFRNDRIVNEFKASLEVAKKSNIYEMMISEKDDFCSTSPSNGVHVLESKLEAIKKEPNLCTKDQDAILMNNTKLIQNYQIFRVLVDDLRKKFKDEDFFIHKHVLSKNESFSQSLVRYLLSGLFISLVLSLLYLYILFEYKKFKNN